MNNEEKVSLSLKIGQLKLIIDALREYRDNYRPFLSSYADRLAQGLEDAIKDFEITNY